jgi:acyl transferase domain-containing protein
MRHRAIPPNMHFKALNPKIQAERYNIEVVQRLVPFPPLTNKDPVIIGINSFGLGGNNAHAIVEEYRPNRDMISNSISNHCTELNQIQSKQRFIFIFSSELYIFCFVIPQCSCYGGIESDIEAR